MSQSTTARAANKPAKPYPDFPLFPYATRRWAKKMREQFRECPIGHLIVAVPRLRLVGMLQRRVVQKRVVDSPVGQRLKLPLALDDFLNRRQHRHLGRADPGPIHLPADRQRFDTQLRLSSPELQPLPINLVGIGGDKLLTDTLGVRPKIFSECRPKWSDSFAQ